MSSEKNLLSHNQIKQVNFELLDHIGGILTMILCKLSSTEAGHLQCATGIDEHFNKHMRISTYGHDIALQDKQLSICSSDQLLPNEIVTLDLFGGVCKEQC